MARVSKQGQVIIPKKLRDQLGMQPGDNVDFVVRGEQVWIVKPEQKPSGGATLEVKWPIWAEWMKRVDGEVVNLHWRRCIYRHLTSITDANPRLDEEEDLLPWMLANYAWTQVMALRRIVDFSRDKNNRSMSNLLADMRSNSHLLTWQSMIARWSGEPIVTECRLIPGTSREEDLRMHSLQRIQSSCLDAFRQLAAPNAEYIDDTTLSRQSGRLEEVRNAIGWLADRSLAHLDKREVLSVPTWAELDNLIDTTIDVFHFVHRVMTGAPKAALPRDNHNWDWALEFAWKPS